MLNENKFLLFFVLLLKMTIEWFKIENISNQSPVNFLTNCSSMITSRTKSQNESCKSKAIHSIS
jgi:hypothetical protein